MPGVLHTVHQQADEQTEALKRPHLPGPRLTCSLCSSILTLRAYIDLVSSSCFSSSAMRARALLPPTAPVARPPPSYCSAEHGFQNFSFMMLVMQFGVTNTCIAAVAAASGGWELQEPG